MIQDIKEDKMSQAGPFVFEMGNYQTSEDMYL